MSVVIDASIALSWVLPGEKASPSLTLRDKLVDSPETGLLVPPNYWYEVANTLWVAVRRERITHAVATEMLESLFEFYFTVWPVELSVCLELSFQLGVAVYDSAYLGLALEQNSTLWTLDRALAEAAGRLNVAVEPSFER
ncbi:MAG: type II toxin-antitoxin system VapC family toxin [Firmicutes bacterium]|nr:type II toxin-antitoxin system VapC family toxin [Bacillota bacterium]